jgi:hypothetical protein
MRPAVPRRRRTARRRRALRHWFTAMTVSHVDRLASPRKPGSFASAAAKTSWTTSSTSSDQPSSR